MTTGTSNSPPDNPLPKILEYLTPEFKFLYIRDIQDIFMKVTKLWVSVDAVMLVLNELQTAGYVELNKIRDNVYTIKRLKNGN